MNILDNYKFIHLDKKDNRFALIDTEATLQIWIKDGSISDGDIVIRITPETVQVAEEINKIVLK